jgi:heme/copper-type cytochrome/quinol oxidase subunit 4
MRKIINLFVLLLFTATAYSQTETPAMADSFRQDGKIYVVVLVLSIVFTCLATYLIIIDRKLKKLEEKK